MVLDKMINRPYSIEGYNPQWTTQFEEVKKNLSRIFGEKALAIEHVGSTSIPGMQAKPIIDSLVLVSQMEHFDKERKEMSALGYENGDNYIAPDTLIFFKTAPDGSKLENIHICVQGSHKATQFVIMRDYFRSHPEKVKEYSDLKQKLKEKFPDDYIAYRIGKHQFLEDIETLARAELYDNKE